MWRKPQSGGNWPNDGQQGQEAGGFTPDLSEFEFLSPEEIQEQLRILQGYQGIQPQGQIQAGYGDGNQGAGGYQDEEYEGYDDGGGYDEYERAIAEAEMRRPGRRTGGPTTSRYTNEDEMLQQAIQMSLMINEPEESPQPPRPPTSSTGTIPKPSWYRMTPSASSTPQANTPQSRQYVPTPQSGQSNVSSTSRAASRISIQLEHSFPQHNVPPTMRSQTESGLTQKKIDEINLANELYAQQLLGQRAGQQTPLTPSSDLYSLTSFANQTPFGLPVGTGQPESSMYTPRPTPRSRTLRLGTPQTRTRHADVYQRTTGHLRTPSSIRRPSAPPSPPSEPGSDRYIHQFLENALVRTVPPQLDLRSRSTGIPLGSSIDQITSSQWLTPEERAQEIIIHQKLLAQQREALKLGIRNLGE